LVTRTVVIKETTAEGVSYLTNDRNNVDCVVVVHDPPKRDCMSFLETVSSEPPVIVAPDGGSSKLATRALGAGATSYVDPAAVETESNAVVDEINRCLSGETDATHESHRNITRGKREMMAHPDGTDERIEKVASMISHELRNPIQKANSGIDLARTECESAYLDEVAETLDRMDQLIDSLLDQLKHDVITPEMEPVDLAAVVDDSWYDRTSAKLVVESPLPMISAEETRLRQLLENLFRNAVEHAGETVTIRVGVIEPTERSHADDSIGLYVADDGPGIKPAQREVVFEYGYTGSEDGTGFGLGIVTEIIEAFGWDIIVTESHNGGARFEIRGIKTA